MPGIVKDNGGVVIEVNPDYSMFTRIATLKLEGPSGVMLPQVVGALGGSN